MLINILSFQRCNIAVVFASKKLSPMTIHFMASTVINAYCDIILHNMTKKAAAAYIKDIMEFTRYGSMHLMGIKAN